MPRKTAYLKVSLDRAKIASMRPRPDAAENQRKPDGAAWLWDGLQ